MTHHSITNEAFISVWQKASSGREAAEQLGVPSRYAYQWANYLRKNGVLLKKFPTNFSRGNRSHSIDMSKLAKLAESLIQSKEDTQPTDGQTLPSPPVT